MDVSRLDTEDIVTYLSFLDPDPKTRFAFMFLDIDSNKPVMANQYFTQEELLKFLALPPKIPYTLHTTLNQMDNRGRKTQNVQSLRTLCLDIDKPKSRDEILAIIEAFKPHLVVKSSESEKGIKAHFYWKIDPYLDHEDWLNYMRGVAHMLGGDYSAASLAKTIRVPGVVRKDKAGKLFLPPIVYVEENPIPLTSLTITEYFPNLAEHIALAKEARKVECQRLAAHSKAMREAGGSTRKFDSGLLGRNEMLFLEVKELTYTTICTLEEAKAFGEELAKSFLAKPKDPFTREEMNKTIESAHSVGLQAREASELKKIEKRAEAKEKAKAGSMLGADEEGEDVVSMRLDARGSNKATVKNGKVESVTLSYNYDYDYSEAMLKENRFSDDAMETRVLQRFSTRMCRIGKELYAFSESERTWNVQSKDYHPQLSDFVKACGVDVLYDPLFKAYFASSDAKVKAAREKFMGAKVHRDTISAVFNSSAVKRLPRELFDAVPHLLYVGNGVLNMLDWSLRDAAPEDRLLKRSTEVMFVPGAECPRWKEFLSEIFAEAHNPTEMCNFMQELFGYSISGSIGEQKLFCHFGDGSNGKSKILSALNRLLGDYCTYLEADDLTKKKLDNKSFERFGAKVDGKRVGIIDDVEVGAVWNEGTVKNLTADKLRARAEYEQSREISNRTKMHLGLNEAPAPEAQNHGIMRRLCFINYDRRFEADSASGNRIDSLIREEISGILNWAVIGYQRYAARGTLNYPASVNAATRDYEEAHFISEEAVVSLFEKVSEGEENWLLLKHIVKVVNDQLRDTSGFHVKDISPDKLSSILRRVFGAKAKRARIEGSTSDIKYTQLNIKLRIFEPDSSTIL